MSSHHTNGSSHPSASQVIATPSNGATPSAPADVQPAVAVVAPPGDPANGPVLGPAPTPSLGSLIVFAMKQLDVIESSLNLDIVVRPNDKDQNRALKRVTNVALGLASEIVSEAPASFPAFAGLPGATAYVQAMTPLAARALALATHLQSSIDNKRAPAALQTLALYGVAKNVGRIVESQAMRDHVAALKTEIAPKRANPRPKKTKAQRAAATAVKSTQARIAKAKAFLEQNGYALPDAPAPGAPASPTPPVAPPGAPAPLAPPTPASTSAASALHAASASSGAAPSATLAS